MLGAVVGLVSSLAERIAWTRPRRHSWGSEPSARWASALTWRRPTRSRTRQTMSSVSSAPIDLWINCAMVTVYAPFDAVAPDEFERVTRVVYLGSVNGTRAALRRM